MRTWGGVVVVVVVGGGGYNSLTPVLNICRNEARYWSQLGRPGPMLSSAEIEEGIASSTCATRSGGRRERRVPTEFLQPPQREGTFERFCPGWGGGGGAPGTLTRSVSDRQSRLQTRSKRSLRSLILFWDAQTHPILLLSYHPPGARTRTLDWDQNHNIKLCAPPPPGHSGIFQRFSTKTRVWGECGTLLLRFWFPESKVLLPVLLETLNALWNQLPGWSQSVPNWFLMRVCGIG